MVQVWCVPIMGKAVKVRTVELPFVAMAWVNPTPQARPPRHFMHKFKFCARWCLARIYRCVCSHNSQLRRRSCRNPAAYCGSWKKHVLVARYRCS